MSDVYITSFYWASKTLRLSIGPSASIARWFPFEQALVQVAQGQRPLRATFDSLGQRPPHATFDSLGQNLLHSFLGFTNSKAPFNWPLIHKAEVSPYLYGIHKGKGFFYDCLQYRRQILPLCLLSIHKAKTSQHHFYTMTHNMTPSKEHSKGLFEGHTLVSI